MPTYSVVVPFTEKELGKDSKSHKKDFAVDANDPLEAMQKAMESFQSLKVNPYASWKVVVDSEHIQAREMDSGEVFRLSRTKSGTELYEDAMEIPLFNEAMLNVESKERLIVLEKALQLARTASDAGEAANSVLKLCLDTTACEAGSVLMYDRKRDDLYFLAAAGPKAAEVMKFRVPCGKGLVGYCYDSGQTVVISDAQKDDRFYKKLASELGFDTRSILAVPLFYRGNVLGVLELINKAPDDYFSGSDTMIAQYLGDFLAILLMALSHD